VALKEKEKELRGLRSESHRHAVAREEALLHVENEWSEGVEVGKIVRRDEFENALRSL
jgi:hypothetical protein